MTLKKSLQPNCRKLQSVSLHLSTRQRPPKRLSSSPAHLDIAVVVAGVTAVAWVHQNSVEAVHYRVAWALRHVGSDIQEFWVAHILKNTQQSHLVTKKMRGWIENKPVRKQETVQPTFVILPPLKLANLFSETVRTLEVRWTVKRLVAGTFFLHLI